MPLFEIPGWSIPSDPIVKPREHGSKKRKRPSSDANRLESMEVNLEKLVKRLKGSSEAEDKNRDRKQAEHTGSSVRNRGNAMRRGNKSKTDDIEERKKTISLPKPLKVTNMDSDVIIVSPRTKFSKGSRSAADSSPSKNVSPAMNTDGSTPAGLTSLQKGMKQSLNGARFRQVWNSLNSHSSTES
jgi:ribosomal RNA-processing protein 8